MGNLHANSEQVCKSNSCFNVLIFYIAKQVTSVDVLQSVMSYGEVINTIGMYETVK